jgi:hypothetical protein
LPALVIFVCFLPLPLGIQGNCQERQKKKEKKALASGSISSTNLLFGGVNWTNYKFSLGNEGI